MGSCRCFGRRLEQAEDGLRIAEDVGRADEAAHRPPHASTATSALIAADAPLESESWCPARIARNGM